MTFRTAVAVAFITVTPIAALAADDRVFAFAQSDRLEYVSSDGGAVWDLQGWVGTDYHKLWVKAEGHTDDSVTEDSELQALYSLAHTPFFDLQVGLRQDFQPASRTHLVVGIQGLAPQWFEVDAALFVDERGKVSARLEVEYDLLLTQRLVLQPRIEANLAFNSVPNLGIGSGLVDTDVGLRLRYELHRKFAPYVGVRWERLNGSTADFAAAVGEDDDDVSFVFGLQGWF